MPITEADVDAMKARIMELEGTVATIGKLLKEHPDSAGLAKQYEDAKDQITKLNLRIEHLEKPKPRAKEENNADDDSEIDFC